ncbi:MAG TPA: T9SS type A sorting domain-containing protein, partial [Candidatus Kapabacteria bacterium]|nr:T9SS type A sorting domain-containing protein [Candidatus Kapabacteria bacterium]
PMSYFIDTNNIPVDSMLDVDIYSLAADSDGVIYGHFEDVEGDEIFDLGIYSSTDNGEHWQPMDNLDKIFTRWGWGGGITIGSHDQLIVIDGELDGYLSISTDKGNTWSRTNVVSMDEIEAVAMNAQGDFFVDGAAGVYHSSDNGTTWHIVNSGMNLLYGPEYGVFCFTFDSAGNVYAGTEFNGVFKGFGSTLSGRNINDPGDFTLGQNFPNPVNIAAEGTTSFTTDIPVFLDHNEHVTIKIYDAVGRYVSTIADNEYPPGANRFTWNATGVQNGVYYCQMAAAGQIQMRKITVQR